MALNSVIVYFPWGGAGNLGRNVINLDTRFEFIDDQQNAGHYPTQADRYNWLLGYYQRPMEPDLWLPREWSIRAKMHARYYDNSKITYWNPNYLLSYDVHGGQHEIDGILESTTLQCFDRMGIQEGRRQEQISSWTLRDCQHVFLIPKDIKTIT